MLLGQQKKSLPLLRTIVECLEALLSLLCLWLPHAFFITVLSPVTQGIAMEMSWIVQEISSHREEAEPRVRDADSPGCSCASALLAFSGGGMHSVFTLS